MTSVSNPMSLRRLVRAVARGLAVASLLCGVSVGVARAQSAVAVMPEAAGARATTGAVAAAARVIVPLGIGGALVWEGRRLLTERSRPLIEMALGEVEATGETDGPAVGVLRQILAAHRLIGSSVLQEEMRRQTQAMPHLDEAQDALHDALFSGGRNPTLTERLRQRAGVLIQENWLKASANSIMGRRTDTSFNDPQSPEGLEVHHSIPRRLENFDDARDILTKWHLSIHDPANGAILPYSCHRGVLGHGNNPTYQTRVTGVMNAADAVATSRLATAGMESAREVVLEAIRGIGDFMDMTCGNLQSRALHASMRSFERGQRRPHVTHYNQHSGIR